jgi:hypothetical protein
VGLGCTMLPMASSHPDRDFLVAMADCCLLVRRPPCSSRFRVA